jgi:hypothetical protein
MFFKRVFETAKVIHNSLVCSILKFVGSALDTQTDYRPGKRWDSTTHHVRTFPILAIHNVDSRKRENCDEHNTYTSHPYGYTERQGNI